jgi:hypothetical protein
VVSAWIKINAGRRENVCLAVDYDVTGRAEARFTDLLSSLRAQAPNLPAVFEATQPALGTQSGMSGADYVNRWVDDIRTSGWQVTSILGFCAGATFAAGIASELERIHGTAPRLVLLDPETPDAMTLYYHFHRVVGGLATGLPHDQVTDLQAAGNRIATSGKPLDCIAVELTSAFRDVVPVAFAAAGLDEDFAEELVLTYESFLAYLVAATHVDHRPAWKRATVLTSRSPHSGLNRVPDGERAGLVAEELLFDVDHIDLLRSPEVSARVSDLLK